MTGPVNQEQPDLGDLVELIFHGELGAICGSSCQT